MGIQKESTDLNSDLSWLTHADSKIDSQPLLLELSRALGVTIFLSFFYHLAKNL